VPCPHGAVQEGGWAAVDASLPYATYTALYWAARCARLSDNQLCSKSAVIAGQYNQYCTRLYWAIKVTPVPPFLLHYTIHAW